MVTVTLGELERNAILAALDDRVAKMGQQLVTLSAHPESSSRDFAIETTRAAIRDAIRATLEIVEAESPEYPPEMTISQLSDPDWTPGEYVAGWGK